MSDYILQIPSNIVLIVLHPIIKKDCIFGVICQNKYVRSCTSNLKRHPTSFSYLIDRDLSQSQCIKLGLALESLLCEFILFCYPTFENIRPPIVKKGDRETDHLFKCDQTRTIIYAELKCNLNLDTGKSKSTWKKCLVIKDKLMINYPGYEIKWGLVGLRYTERHSFPETISSKYTALGNHLYGLNDYFRMIGPLIPEYEESEYRKIVNFTVNECFD